MNLPVLCIHGGATFRREYPEARATAASLDRIRDAALGPLQEGAPAMEAVTLAVEALEADPQFNAGYGSKLQSDGIARLSASAMDGVRRRFGAVINVERLRHPSRLARHLLEEQDRVMDGLGADSLAEELSLTREDCVTESRWVEWERSQASPTGTVGAVALDREGRLAAMTSTGGRGMERPGRVSDSGTPAGNYADRFAAVSCTGVGEDILDLAVAPRLAAMISAGIPAAEAADRMETEIREAGRHLGFIGIAADGTGLARWTTECMTYRIWTPTQSEGWPT